MWGREGGRGWLNGTKCGSEKGGGRRVRGERQTDRQTDRQAGRQAGRKLFSIFVTFYQYLGYTPNPPTLGWG